MIHFQEIQLVIDKENFLETMSMTGARGECSYVVLKYSGPDSPTSRIMTAHLRLQEDTLCMFQVTFFTKNNCVTRVKCNVSFCICYFILIAVARKGLTEASN